MRTCFPIALLCVSTLCSTATSAAPLDSFTAKQSAISTRSRASTRLVEGARNSTWAARTFITEARGICKQGTPSSATLGTDGNGSVFFQSNNTQGTSSITWELKPALKGRAIGEVRFEVFDASPITSPPPSPVTLTAFVKVEDNDKTTYTISTKATLKGASRRRSLFFNLKDRLPQNISASLLRPTRITIGIRQLDRCETLVGIRRVSFSEKPFPGPVDLLRAGRQQSAAKKPVKPSSVQAISAAAPQMSPSPVASPTVMTCANEYPDVIMEKINECLRQVHKSDSPPSECADVSCECTDHAGKDYTIEVVQSNVQPKGTACLQTNTTCKMQDGLCNEFGRCVPKALVDVNPDDFGFIDNPDADMSEQCLNTELSPNDVPSDDFLCTATVDDIRNLAKKLMKPPGTPCTGTDPDGTEFAGVCSFVNCVRPPPPTNECDGKAQCTDCDPEGFSSNGACWNGACFKMSDFEALHCQGFSDPCLECQGVPICNPDGHSSRKERAVNEGGSCTLANGMAGVCRRGKCTNHVTVTPRP